MPARSPIIRISQVTAASVRKFKVQALDDKSLLYETADLESNFRRSRKLGHTNKLKNVTKTMVILYIIEFTYVTYTQ